MKLRTADKLVDFVYMEKWKNDHATNLKLILHLDTDNHWHGHYLLKEKNQTDRQWIRGIWWIYLSN